MQITRNSIETRGGPGEWFTGAVYVDAVGFTHWIVAVEREQRSLHAGRADGVAHPSEWPDDLRHRRRRPLPAPGGPVETIFPGDRVFFEPSEEHWHGAAPDRFMTHLALLQVDEAGKSVDWESMSPTTSTASRLDNRAHHGSVRFQSGRRLTFPGRV